MYRYTEKYILLNFAEDDDLVCSDEYPIPPSQSPTRRSSILLVKGKRAKKKDWKKKGKSLQFMLLRVYQTILL